MFKKEIKNNKIIFTDIDNKQTITIEHYDNPQSSDIFKINKNLSIEFIKYILKELTTSNDINACYGLYDDRNLETILSKSNFKIINYEYKILYKHLFNDNTNLIIDNKFEKEEMEYALQKINNENKKYQNYYKYNNEFNVVNEEYFNVNNTYKNVYRYNNNKIVGVVDYQISEIDNNICIRFIVSDDEKIKEDIIKSLLNKYKKDIIISFRYKDTKLKNLIRKFDNEFQYTLYMLDNLI